MLSTNLIKQIKAYLLSIIIFLKAQQTLRENVHGPNIMPLVVVGMYIQSLSWFLNTAQNYFVIAALFHKMMVFEVPTSNPFQAKSNPSNMDLLEEASPPIHK